MRVRNGFDVVGLCVSTAVVLLVAAHAADASQGPSPRREPAPYRSTVVETSCIDGRVNQSIDDGHPDGLLAYDTGVSC